LQSPFSPWPGSLARPSSRKPTRPFVKKAEKYGAKNCLFCHKQPPGGEGWNKRGDWLIAEKDKRKADAIDVTWLEEYKEEAEGEGEKKPQQ
jgi:hypothetical protein